MEAAVLCGTQGSGKTSFSRERFFGTHVRISRELLRTPHREARFVALCLDTRQPFVVDKVSATAKDRRAYAAPARAAGFRCIAHWLDVRPRDAIARNAGRAGEAKIPVAGILGAYERLVVPSLEEGFDEVHRVTLEPGEGFRVAA